MDFEKSIELIEAKLGYTFRDKSLLRQAFTRSSYCNEHRGRGGVKYMSNEVLEFFGDSVLSTAIISLLLEERTSRYEYGIRTELGEGDFTAIRSHLSDKRNLSASMSELGLQKFLIMSEGDTKLGIENEPSVMEDLFESILGAIYFDSEHDLPLIIDIVEDLLDTDEYLEKHTVKQSASPYNALQEFCQARGLSFAFEKIGQTGPDHKPTYTYACLVEGKKIAEGQGQSGAKAKAAAAAAALPILEKQ